MPDLPSVLPVISMFSVDWRPSQPQSLRMLKAPTGFPMRSAIFSSNSRST